MNVVNVEIEKPLKRIMPTQQLRLFGRKVDVYGFGVIFQEPEINWTLRGLTDSSDPRTSHMHVFDVLTQLPGLLNVYAPSPVKFNSRIVSPRHFKTSEIGEPVHFGEERKLYRGIDADGVGNLRPGDAYMMSPADCALIVLHFRGNTWIAHAGRNSLMDRKHIDTDGKETSKQDRSVVDAIMENIPRHQRHEVEVFIGFSISSGPHFEHRIDHPTYGNSNKLMLKWIADQHYTKEERNSFGRNFWELGQIDIRSIIKRQFRQNGAKGDNLYSDNICTYSNVDGAGNHRWYSERRTPGMRNLIVGVCRS